MYRDSYPQVDGNLTELHLKWFVHDINRPSKTENPLCSWRAHQHDQLAGSCKLKRPGMHLLSSIQAVMVRTPSSISSGVKAEEVLKIPWRCGGSLHENTRVFRMLQRLARSLKADLVVGSTAKPDVAVIYDWENYWAMRMPRTQTGKEGLPADMSDALPAVLETEFR